MRYYLYLLCIAWNVAVSFYVSRQLLPLRHQIFQVAGRRKPYRANYPRKMKRILRSSNDTISFMRVINSTYEGLLQWLCHGFIFSYKILDYLKYNASERMHESLMQKIRKKARKLNITVDPDYAKRTKTLRPTMMEWLNANGSFTVRSIFIIIAYSHIVRRLLMPSMSWK